MRTVPKGCANFRFAKGLNHMSCASCSNNNYQVNSVSNSNTNNCSCGSTAGATTCQCRLAVTVEDDFTPCMVPQNYFDVAVRNRNGELVASGKVAGGSSIILTLPSEGEYAVTVTGGICSSPRAQTRRVRCCCDSANGVSFIFMRLEQDCVHRPPHHCCCCCPPAPRPPMPPCPPGPRPPRPPRPPHHFPCGDEGIDPHDVIIIAEDNLQGLQ